MGAVLGLAILVLSLFGPATRATLRPEGHLTFAGGIVRQRAVDVRRIERISVGALYLRGLLFIHDGDGFPAVMLAPVDGIARLLDEARRRHIPIMLDGL